MVDIYKNSCFGCSACEAVCPTSAISMKKDEYGFIYPVVNKDLCIECNKCKKTCPVNNYNNALNETTKTSFYVRHNDLKEVKTSRSGAAFSGLSEVILNEGGVVYGAAYDQQLKVKHLRATNILECTKFKGSKYVQSDMTGVIKQIVLDLKNGRTVLFSGTPCQNAGIKNSINSNLAERLFLVDIVCHGVPSPKLFEDYKAYVEDREGARIISFDFRDKTISGWSDHRESMVLEGDKVIVSKQYANLFYTNMFFRSSCYKCPFASLQRAGDITLADFWGWEKIDASINKDDLGISLVLINSKKGKEWFDKAKKFFTYKSVDIQHCLQRNLKEPSHEPSLRKEYLDYYNSYGFNKLIVYLFSPSLSQRLWRRTKRILNKWKK